MQQLSLFSNMSPSSKLIIPSFPTPLSLEKFLDELNVVDVALHILGNRIQKRAVSLNYVGLCPFHHEKTPSFYIRPKRNDYVCYGCGSRGNGPLTLAYNLDESGHPNSILEDLLSQAKLPFVDLFKDPLFDSNKYTSHQLSFVTLLGEAVEYEKRRIR